MVESPPRALVTGAAGLVGSAIVRALGRRGAPVRALVRPGRPRGTLDGAEVELVEGDVLDPATLTPALRGVDVVFHTATYFAYGAEDPEALERLAVDGVAHVLRAAAAAGVRRFVLTSSSVVFGYGEQPEVLDETDLSDGATEGAYVRSKIRQDLAAHRLAAALGLDLISVCPTMTLGPHPLTLGPSNGVVTSYLADPLRLTFGGGCNLVAADDVGEGHVLVATRGVTGGRYILGGENLTWPELHRMISDLAGLPPPSLTLGRAGSDLAARAAEFQGRLGGPRLTTREQAAMVGRYYWYNHARAAALGYAPRPIRPVLAETLGYFVATPHVSRETRARLTLSPEVWAARASLEALP